MPGKMRVCVSSPAATTIVLTGRTKSVDWRRGRRAQPAARQLESNKQTRTRRERRRDRSVVYAWEPLAAMWKIEKRAREL